MDIDELGLFMRNLVDDSLMDRLDNKLDERGISEEDALKLIKDISNQDFDSLDKVPNGLIEELINIL